MSGSDYGIYVYVWTWVLLLGSTMDFGIAPSSQKIIPEYRARGDLAALRGFLSGGRWVVLAASSTVALLLAGVIHVASPWIDPNAIVPLYIGCLTLPPFVVANTQDGISRAHDWMQLGLMPQFIVRQGADHRVDRRRAGARPQSRRHGCDDRRAPPRSTSRRSAR